MFLALFASMLGFSLAAALGGLVSNWSRADILIMVLTILAGVAAALFDPAMQDLGAMRVVSALVTLSVFDKTVWFLAGAALAILSIMAAEGLFGGFLKPWQDLFGITPAKPAVSALGPRDELFAKLCLYAFQEGRRTILTDLETALRAGVGTRQLALHAIAAPGVRGYGRIDPVFLIRQYKTHYDATLSSAPIVYAMLCRMAMITGSNTAATTKRLHKIGHALELDRGQMNDALSRA